MKKIIKRTLATLLTVLMLLAVAPVIASAATVCYTNFHSADYSSDPGQYMTNIALAQAGRSGSSLGYTEQWCAYFVSDCARISGQTEAIPATGWVPTLYDNILNAGGTTIYNAKNGSGSLSKVKAGDIAILDTTTGGASSRDHVEIVYSVNGSSVSTVGGNSGAGSSLYTREVKKHNPYSSSRIVYILRPNYTGSQVTEYANLGEDFYAVVLNTACWKPISQVADSEHIFLDSETGSARQKWRFQRQDDGAYVISSCYDGKVLEMYCGDTSICNHVSACGEFWGGMYQQWYLIPQGDGYVFLSKHFTSLNRVMDLYSGSSNDGNTIQINERNNSNAQIWSVYKSGNVQLGKSVLSTTVSSPKVTFDWENVYGAKYYDLKIFSDESCENNYYTKWGATSGFAMDFPAGTYYAYICACDYYSFVGSDNIKFVVNDTLERPKLNVNINSYTATFNWNTCSGASSYDIKIWKDAECENDNYHTEWNAKSGYSINLPAGTYYAYVCSNNSVSCKGSSNICFTIENKIYNVTYNANGGTGSPSSQTKTYGTDLVLSSTVPTRTGYTFLGWSADKNATTATYRAGGTYSENADIILYAVWSPITLSSITIKTNPSKLSYYVGDNLDTNGLTLTATYSDGTSKTITSGFTCTPTKLTTAGTQAITVSYGGKSATFNVTVNAVTLSSIAIKTNSSKLSYYVGDNLDTNGLTLTATYSDGTSKTITSGFTCTPTKLTTAGTQKITVSYGDKTCSFDVEVTNRPIAEKVVHSVSVDGKSINYKSTAKITPSITADEGADYTVTYSSSNSNVSVDNNGNIYGAKKGNATITCTVTDSFGNKVSDTCNVTVNYSAIQWIIKILLFGWLWY